MSTTYVHIISLIAKKEWKLNNIILLLWLRHRMVQACIKFNIYVLYINTIDNIEKILLLF